LTAPRVRSWRTTDTAPGVAQEGSTMIVRSNPGIDMSHARQAESMDPAMVDHVALGNCR